MTGATTGSLLDVRNLAVSFPIHGGVLRRVVDQVHAVRDVTFTLDRGRALGLVGESGSGKSTAARAVLRLIDPTAGTIHFDGRPIHDASADTLRPLRRRMQVVFQDPGASMNPRMRVASIVAEPLEIHRVGDRRSRRRAVAELLDQCGLPGDAALRYPHEFSGGQKQRITIARAIAIKPDLLILDEPTSALDVSVQAQILNLLSDLQERHGLAYLFISHDIAVVEHVCDRIAVMRQGRIVEIGDRDDVIRHPAHEYTRTLLAAVPRIPTRGETDDDPDPPVIVTTMRSPTPLEEA